MEGFPLRRIVLWTVVAIIVLGRTIFSPGEVQIFGASAAGVAQGSYDPRGFRFRHVDPTTGEPVRYDACAPIHYAINPDGAPPQGVEDVHRAIEETARATGHEFVYDGETDERPTPERPAYQPDVYGEQWAPILIAWAPDLAIPEGAGEQPAGLGGSEFRANDEGESVYVTGSAVFNTSVDLNSGYGGQTWGQVMIHELGHVVGLDHVEDPASVMHPRMTLRPAAWGEGDRRGLWELGLGRECRETPPLP